MMFYIIKKIILIFNVYKLIKQLIKHLREIKAFILKFIWKRLSKSLYAFFMGLLPFENTFFDSSNEEDDDEPYELTPDECLRAKLLVARACFLTLCAISLLVYLYGEFDDLSFDITSESDKPPEPKKPKKPKRNIVRSLHPSLDHGFFHWMDGDTGEWLSKWEVDDSGRPYSDLESSSSDEEGKKKEEDEFPGGFDFHKYDLNGGKKKEEDEFPGGFDFHKYDLNGRKKK